MHEWVYSGAYNEIGHLYIGYKTTNEKLVNALLFELVRAKNYSEPRFQIHADYDFRAPDCYIKSG